MKAGKLVVVGAVVAAVGGAFFWNHRKGREPGWFVDQVRNLEKVQVSPSNSTVVTEEFTRRIRGPHARERHGLYTQYWITGNKWQQGRYEEGEKVGTWTRWDQHGNKLEERVFENGKEVSLEVFEVPRKPFESPEQIARPFTGIDIPEGFDLSNTKTKSKTTVDPNAPGYVDDFGLFDHEGAFRKLYYYSKWNAVVLFVHGVGCPIVRHNAIALEALRKKYADQKVAFLMLNTSLQDDRDEIAKDAEKLGIEMPILKDESQIVGRGLKVTRTAEAIVIDPKTWTVAWRGALDDRVNYETQRSEAKHTYLDDALAAVVAGKRSPDATGELRGCLVKIDEVDGAEISYADDVAPILLEHCTSCHVEGGVGPWAMEDYDDIYGWSDMIREVVMSRRMPPWVIDHERSHSGVRRVAPTAEQIATLVNWLDAGAPRGEGEDPLLENTPKEKAAQTWTLGEPDWLITTPTTKIPATGVLEWTYVDVAVPFEEDKWVRAVDIRPSNLEVLHHGAALLEYPKHLEHLQPEYNQALSSYFAMYLPGKDVEQYPDDAGVWIPAGSRIRFQLHYTTTGKATTDRTSMALYFHGSKPANELKILSAFNSEFEIPPRAPEHDVIGEYTFERDVRLHGVFPHMHFRGRAMALEAVRPGGEGEMLVSMPYYRYDWQRYYPFDDPPRLPAGTKIINHGVFDNSADNSFNPDPSAVVHHGGQSWDEMFVAWLYVVEAGAASAEAPTESRTSPGTHPAEDLPRTARADSARGP